MFYSSTQQYINLDDADHQTYFTLLPFRNKKGRTLLHSAHGTPIPDNECKQNTSKGCIPLASTLSALIWRFRADDC